MKADEYVKLLNEFYDDKFLFSGKKDDYEGILKRNGSILKLNKPCRINETIIKYRRAPGEGCKNCEEIFQKVIKLQKLIFNYLKKNPTSTKEDVHEHVKKVFPHIKVDDSNFKIVHGSISGEFKSKKKKKKEIRPPDYNIKFHGRPMEFPGFHETLDFDKEHVKDIMIIGEAAGPTIATHINCTYGLSNTDIIVEKQVDEEGKIINKWKIDTERIFNLLKKHSSDIGKSLDLLKVKSVNLKGKNLDEQIEKFRKSLHNNLWERLGKILNDSLTLETLKSKVYITDLVKCNARGNDMWKHFKEKCFERFLIHEIRIINPKLIIFLGNSGYYHLKKLKKKFKFDECCPTDNEFPPKNHPEYKKYKIHDFRDDKYLKIYYDEYKKKEKFNNESFSEFKGKLINKQNIPKRFPTFGTVSFKNDPSKAPTNFIKIFHNSGRTASLWKIYTEAYKDFINDLVEDKIITF